MHLFVLSGGMQRSTANATQTRCKMHFIFDIIYGTWISKARHFLQTNEIQPFVSFTAKIFEPFHFARFR